MVCTWKRFSSYIVFDGPFHKCSQIMRRFVLEPRRAMAQVGVGCSLADERIREIYICWFKHLSFVCAIHLDNFPSDYLVVTSNFVNFTLQVKSISVWSACFCRYNRVELKVQCLWRVCNAPMFGFVNKHLTISQLKGWKGRDIHWSRVLGTTTINHQADASQSFWMLINRVWTRLVKTHSSVNCDYSLLQKYIELLFSLVR